VSYTLHLVLDVNHGFSLYPRTSTSRSFRLRLLTLHQAEQAGEYRIVCNEFCGINHHNMLGRIVVRPAKQVAQATPEETR
jgi:cytochrome c oxidase subunit 2